MLRPRHGMVDPRRLTSRTFAPLLYAITRQPSSFSSFARARAAEGLGDCHNALRANSIPAGFLACPHVLDHTSPGRLVSAHGSDFLPPRPLGGSGMTCPRCQHENRAAARFCEECGTPLRRPEASAQPTPSYADLQRSLDVVAGERVFDVGCCGGTGKTRSRQVSAAAGTRVYANIQGARNAATAKSG